jgi:hypothetical protein
MIRKMAAIVPPPRATKPLQAAARRT